MTMTGLGKGWSLALLGGAGAVMVGAAPVLAAESAIGASLFGENEVDHEGAGEDAGGDFAGYIDTRAGTLCYYLETYGLEDVTAAHLHEGAKDANGPPVVTLEANADDEVCVEVDKALLERIVEEEDAFYVNVHTEALPEGAIRGQLGS